MSLFLDWNSTSPPHPNVLAAQAQAREVAWANPASTHGPGRAARKLLEQAREEAARVLRVHPRDVLFTSGGTESNHLALSGATSLVTSQLEHPSIVQMTNAAEARGVPVRWIAVSKSGQIEPESLREHLETLARTKALGERPVVAVMAANHETGVIQPLELVRPLADEYGAHLHIDAVQVLGRAPLEPLLLADSLSVAPHKFQGPKGLGVYAFRCTRPPLPLGRGGSQERGLRPGTQDASLAAGLTAALQRLDGLQAEFRALRAARDHLEAAVLRRGAVLHAGGAPRLDHITNFRIPRFRGDELVAALDLQGVAVSSGSACSAGTTEASPVLTAMLGREAALGAIRVSLGPGMGNPEVTRFLQALDAVTGRSSLTTEQSIT